MSRLVWKMKQNCQLTYRDIFSTSIFGGGLGCHIHPTIVSSGIFTKSKILAPYLETMVDFRCEVNVGSGKRDRQPTGIDRCS